MNIYRDLAKSVENVVRFEPERQRAKLGYVYKGTYTIVDPDDQRFYFARFPDGGFVRARHYGKVSPIADADVFVVKEKGGHRLEPVLSQYEAGKNTGNDASVGYHTHARGTALVYEVDPWLLTGLRPTLDNGLIVAVSTGFYKHAGALKYFAADTIDLTSVVPATASHHGYVIVALDTAANTLTAYAGTTTFEFVELDESSIDDINIGDDLPLFAILLVNAQTEVNEADIVDLRFTPVRDASLLSTVSEVLTLSSDAATATATKSFFLIAAQTGTSDDLATLTVTGQPRLILLQADAGDTITVKHGTGNIQLSAEIDDVLSGEKTLALFWDGTDLADVAPGNIGTLNHDLNFNGYNALAVNKLNYDNSTELTIASGAVTVTQSWHRIDTEGDAGTDDLDTINGGSDGETLYLRAEHVSRTVVIKHDVGNIRTFDQLDITLNQNYQCVALLYDGNLNVWMAIALYNGGSGGGSSGYFAGDAFDVPYDPTDVADWSTTPDNVGSALDRLASDLPMVLLSDTELGSDGSFDVSSISQDFNHLLLRMYVRSNESTTFDYVDMYFNNDTTNANYRYQLHYSTGSGSGIIQGDEPVAILCPGSTALADMFSYCEVTIPFYKSARYKTAQCFGGRRESATGSVTAHSYISWESTSAINRIQLRPNGYATHNFVQYSRLMIYGVL